MLEWAHIPYTVSFVPEYAADDCAESDYEQVVPAEAVEKDRHVEREEQGRKQGIEEISWKKQSTQFHVVAEHTNFYLPNEGISTAGLFFLDQTNLAKLL
jgi:hypothetical protein